MYSKHDLKAGRVGENWSAFGALRVPSMLMDHLPRRGRSPLTGHVPGAIPNTGIECCALVMRTCGCALTQGSPGTTRECPTHPNTRS
jgi:hypothetical protein